MAYKYATAAIYLGSKLLWTSSGRNWPCTG